MTRSEEYRGAELERDASQISLAPDRRALLEVAETWRRMADDVGGGCEPRAPARRLTPELSDAGQTSRSTWRTSAREVRMAQYRLYVLTPQGRLQRRESIVADDHESALIAVREAPPPGSVMELWLGGELVKRWPERA